MTMKEATTPLKIESTVFQISSLLSAMSLNLSNVGEFFWSSIPKDFIWVLKKELEKHLLVFKSSTKRRIARKFHYNDGREMQKTA